MQLNKKSLEQNLVFILMASHVTAYNMSEYGFTLTRKFLHKGRIYDSLVIREYASQKTPYSNIFYTVCILED